MNTRFHVPLRYSLAIIISTLMVLASELFGQREIIFPEIAAIAIGCLAVPSRPWNATRPLICLLLTAGALFGLGVSVYMPGGLLPKTMVSFVFCGLCLLLSGSSFYPMISAAILPLYLRTDTIIYPLSVCIIVCIIAVWEYLLEKKGIRSPREFKRQAPDGKKLIIWAVRFVLFFIVAAAFLITDNFYFVAPPLIVVFVSMSEPGNPFDAHPFKAWIVVVLCALLGYLCRMLNIAFAFPLTVCALIAMILVMLLMHKSRIFMPPAGAMSLLPLLLPAQGLWLYPIEVAAGSLALVLVAIALARKISGWYNS
ncbi:MAG: HPP family protein [Oscillospiraceae bacterium]|nr:HPP family protein [Oscillospiraceae bacterium]